MKPRCQIVNEDVTPFYHITSRCIRELWLLMEEQNNRKTWFEEELNFLSEQFSIHVMDYVCMDNHFHLVVRLDTPQMKSWSDLEAVQRWSKVFIPRDVHGKKIDEDKREAWILEQAVKPDFVKKARTTLSSLSCFMKRLKQPLARKCNIEDGKKGAFFESRYKSIGIIGERALIATNVYIDLNPITAKIPVNPACALHSGWHARMEHIQTQGVMDQFIAASDDYDDYDTALVVRRAVEILNATEQSFRLLPVHDARETDSNARFGMSTRLDAATFWKIVEYTARRRSTMAAAMRATADSVPNASGNAASDWSADDIKNDVDCLNILGALDHWGTMRGSEKDLAAAAAKMGRRRFLTPKAPPANPAV